MREPEYLRRAVSLAIPKRLNGGVRQIVVIRYTYHVYMYMARVCVHMHIDIRT